MADDDDDDITRNYHGGNPRSIAANPRGMAKSRDRKRIVEFLYGCGTHGAICEEAETALGLKHQTCSARFSDLKKDRVIVCDTSDAENGIRRLHPIGYRLTQSRSKADVCVLSQFAPALHPEPWQSVQQMDLL